MFRNKGTTRTFGQNFRLATFLSFAAGLVNICGVLALGVLTTNVTGHFAYFAESVLAENNNAAVHFLLFILAFLAGSFTSNWLTEYFISQKNDSPHNAAMFLEIALLLVIGLLGDTLVSDGIGRPFIACVLLFSMGLQNSLVSRVSGAMVRTTHLTGLFTDLGIELSQLFFYKTEMDRTRLFHSIRLRCGIIACFFSGCVLGGFLFSSFRFKILLIAATVLLTALVFNNLKVSVYRIRRRLRDDIPDA